METNTENNTDINDAVIPERNAGSEEIPAGRFNLDICPNCLEPNPDDLAVCPYCGMPLHPGAETDPSAMPENEAELAAARAAAAAPEKKDEKKKPQESGFRRVMPWLGLYLIYYAITGIIETSRQEELSSPALAYGSWVIYIIAGVLMAWPLIKKGYRKLFHIPEEDSSEEQPESDSDTDDADALIEGPQPAEEEDPVEADEEADEPEFSRDAADPEGEDEETAE